MTDRKLVLPGSEDMLTGYCIQGIRPKWRGNGKAGADIIELSNHVNIRETLTPLRKLRRSIKIEFIP